MTGPKHRGPAEPMPDWHAGDVIQAYDGTILVRRHDGSWACNVTDCPFTSQHFDLFVRNEWDTGDIRVLVLGGEAVAA